MSQEEATDGHVYFRPPTFWERFWPRLGFHRGRAPRPDADEMEGWAPSWFVVETYVHLGWLDRLRVLVSGKLHVDHAIKTDVPIGRSSAASSIGVLPPNTKRGVP